MPRKGATLAPDRQWRKKVLDALARLRPVVAKLESMLSEARSEVAALEIEERRLEHLDRMSAGGSGTLPSGRVNEYPRSRRKPLLIEDKDKGEE